VKLTTSVENHLVFNVDISSSVQNHYKKFEVKIFIKKEEEVKRIMTTTMQNIIE